MCFCGAVRGYQGLASSKQSEPWCWTHTAIISTERTSVLSKYMFIHVLAWHTGFPYRLLSICMHGRHIIHRETVKFIKGHLNVFSSSCVVQFCVPPFRAGKASHLHSHCHSGEWLEESISGPCPFFFFFFFSFLFSSFLFSPGYAGEPLPLGFFRFCSIIRYEAKPFPHRGPNVPLHTLPVR